MRNNIYNLYKGSLTKKIFDFLFVSKNNLGESLILKKLNYFYIKNLSEIFLLLALALVWYKSILVNYFGVFNKPYLPLILLLLAFIVAKKENYKIKKSFLWLLMFLLISLISGIAAILNGINGGLILLGWILFAQFGLVLLVSTLILSKEKVLKMVTWLSVPMAGYASYQFFAHVQTSSLWVSTLESGTTRVFGFLGSPNVLGSMLALVAFLSLGIYIKHKQNIYLLISIINIFVVGITLSRSAWLGLAAGVIVVVSVLNLKYLLLTPVTLLFLIVPQIRRRVEVALSQSYYIDSTLDGRIWAVINGLHIFKQHIFVGTGPGSYGGQLALSYASPVYLESIQNGYTALYFTDNQFLEILVQTGILGFLAFVGFIIFQFVELIVNYAKNNSKITLAVIGAFVCFLVTSLFANNLEFTAVAMPMAIMLGVTND